MNKSFKVWWVGLSVSFLGTLPPAVLNLIAIEVGLSKGMLAAFMFSAGIWTVEMLFVRVSLVAIEWFSRRAGWFRVIEWLSVIILAGLAYGSFQAAMSEASPDTSRAGFLPDWHPFLIGASLRALNPTMIPFWFGWGTILMKQGVLEPRSSHYTLFSFGLGMGTLAGHSIYIIGGSLAAGFLMNWQHVFYWVIGGLFSLTVVLQLLRILSNKDIAEQLRSTRRIPPDEDSSEEQSDN
ncbi:MAG: LysE family transporter [Saprospiraceae bacterium]|nr:LysE family transporter [Saprospiraceae bacterium]